MPTTSRNEQAKAYAKTKKGIVTKIISHQRASSKTRGMPPPDYTVEELREWLFNQPLFHTLYDEWVASNYDRWKRPSVDRIDDFKPYSFTNIALMTFKENNSKAGKTTRAKQGVKVEQLTLDNEFIQEFNSLVEAAEFCGVSYISIGDACRGKSKTSAGYKWRYK